MQGDGFMIAFNGAARAMRCAVEIQRAFRDYVPAAGEDPIAVHIGINTGDAVVEGDDYIGHTVIVASRLADAAAPGEILVSSLSEQLVAGSGEFAFGADARRPLKGMTRPQMSVSLVWTELSRHSPRPISSPLGTNWAACVASSLSGASRVFFTTNVISRGGHPRDRCIEREAPR